MPRKYYYTRKILERQASGLGGRPELVDRSTGTIRSVKICGHESENGRYYTKSALEAAVRLYEGKRINADHPARADDERPIDNTIGYFQNVRYDGQEPTGGLYGDLVLLNPSLPICESILKAAEQNPSLFGCSHNADISGYYDDSGKNIVVSIDKVRSVDLVSEPATTKSIFESIQRGKPMKLLRLTLTESKLAKRYPKTLKRVLEMEGGDAMDMTGVLDTPVEEPAENAGDWKQSLSEAIAKLINSGTPEDHDKAMQILKMLAPESETPALEENMDYDDEKAMEEDEDMDEDEKKKLESRRRKRKAKSSTSLPTMESICKLVGFAADKHLVSSLEAMGPKAAIDHLIWLKNGGFIKSNNSVPTSSRSNPAMESKDKGKTPSKPISEMTRDELIALARAN